MFEDVRGIALSLENVEEGTSYGTPAFKVSGKLLARSREDGVSLVGTTFEEREEMIAAELQLLSAPLSQRHCSGTRLGRR